MGRKPKSRQRFSFPSADQPKISDIPLTDAEIDAEIDGTGTSSDSANKISSSRRLEQVKQETERKKKAAQIIKEIPEIFTPEQVVWIFDVYVGLICFVFSILLKCEFKLLYEELELDADVKLAWAKPLAKVASKYAPAEWAGMTAEIELIASVGLWTATAFGRSKNVMEKEKQRQLAELQTKRNRSGVTAVSQATQAQATI